MSARPILLAAALASLTGCDLVNDTIPPAKLIAVDNPAIRFDRVWWRYSDFRFVLTNTSGRAISGVAIRCTGYAANGNIRASENEASGYLPPGSHWESAVMFYGDGRLDKVVCEASEIAFAEPAK